jgi:hypothetical protein
VARNIARAGARAGPFFIASLLMAFSVLPFRSSGKKKAPLPLRGAGRLLRCFLALAGLHPARLKDEDVNDEEAKHAAVHEAH